jgi:hypothetical protein
MAYGSVTFPAGKYEKSIGTYYSPIHTTNLLVDVMCTTTCMHDGE